MFNTQSNLEHFIRPKLIWFYEAIVQFTSQEWMAIVFLGVIGIIVGWRLKRFTKPEFPLMSQLTRDLARALLLYPALAVLGSAVLTWAAYFALSWTLDSVAKGIESLSTQIVAVGFGGMVGLFVSAIVYYLLIPLIEKPSVTMANPNAKLKVVDSYDPERYFRV
ncbi:MAG TPA: hypothetical protein PKH72_00055 [Rhodoferax sp.]|jgi:xanthosine utilization system XapX-like protein|nr:hypothetical protein [Rhodoferax sp.]HPW28690.1 hypothetical protein [Rhodoferax sp.]